ncbi:hypothetical protein SAMN04487776_12620 [Priestia megaterium]|nr:hypothetical protein SAMN04487776_12620 [Priestia megaterium]
MTMTFPQLFSNLAAAPLYIMVLIICIGYIVWRYVWKRYCTKSPFS